MPFFDPITSWASCMVRLRKSPARLFRVQNHEVDNILLYTAGGFRVRDACMLDGGPMTEMRVRERGSGWRGSETGSIRLL